MRKLILFIGVALMVSCAPGKKESPTYVDTYCDSCKIKITNEWFEKETDTRVVEIAFEGIVDGYKRVELFRFNSPNTCLRPYVIEKNLVDTPMMYIIEDVDTLAVLPDGGAGFCY